MKITGVASTTMATLDISQSERRPQVVDAAAPRDVVGHGEGVDGSDGQRHRGHGAVHEPVATAYPATAASRPGRARFIPSNRALIPNRLDVRATARIFDVAFEIHRQPESLIMRQQIIAQSQRLTAADADRRIDLDWVRIGAFGLLILYHVGMLYVSWGFHIKSEHRITALEPLMLMLNPWRLALLFLVAGFATRFMLRKYATGALLQSRTVRLLVPLAFGMLVIVPPQAYLQIVESLGYPAGFLDFYRNHYFAFGEQFCRPGPCILLPTWNHLWFVAYLWVYTMALGGVLLVAPRLLERVEQPLGKLLSGSLLLVLPSLVLGLYRLILQPMYPSTHALFGDWYNHALFGTIFLIGFLLARADGFWVAVERQRWLALSIAAVIFLTILGVRWWRLSGYPVPELLRIYAGLAYGTFQWLCMVAVLGFAKRWLTADSAGAADTLPMRCSHITSCTRPRSSSSPTRSTARVCRPGLKQPSSLPARLQPAS